MKVTITHIKQVLPVSLPGSLRISGLYNYRVTYTRTYENGETIAYIEVMTMQTKTASLLAESAGITIE